ncbi:glycoside hydrolase family 43 protein [Bifidobacterium miconisargentati]|uniref:glycoside hydrolase family 43 protein n=1 Tax=Bifidobacterium miconisargentati TaxID=2834437 RepID=UPI001BDBCC25|nr:glycoside hydrolase family 43 protein [Bifidobacterium miconisargentati]MBW3090016.1 family 43 glycosylhydrolase [Bifidobacterium miconisargentati]
MKSTDIHIRDPFVLPHDGVYYMYGTRADNVWGAMDGFDCYTSRDLENWEGPFEVFHKPETLAADRAYWAPECYEKDGVFHLIATLGQPDGRKGVHVLRADNPLGPFEHVGQLTDPAQSCIDGTIFEQDGQPWLVYSHSLEDVPEGDMDAVRLTDDLTATIGDPVTLFKASDAPWSVPVPFAKAEFGIDGDAYFSDGPFLHRLADGRLAMLWSSWTRTGGYAVGQAISRTGEVTGPWDQCPEPVLTHGGHGMLFTGFDGITRYTLHAPNDPGQERPTFLTVTERDGRLALG